MRITFLSWRDTTHPDGGGSERYLEEIAARLTAAGDCVTIVCAAHGTAAADEVVRGVRLRRRGGRLTVYLHGLAFLLTREGRAQDVVVDVVNGVPFAAGLVRRRGLLVLIHHLHREQWQMIYPGLRGRIGWFVESRVTPRLYRHTPHVTVSEATRDDLVGLGIEPPNISVVPAGVDVPATQATRSATPRLCVLARLVPHKQIEDALAAVAELGTEFPTLHLDVIGDGWWRRPLVRRSAELHVEDRVTFHGRVPAGRRDELLSRAWLMLAPSVREGWGIAIMEAAAVGTPTVAYRSAGGTCNSIADGLSGALAADRGELVAITARLLLDEAARSRLGETARSRAAGFTWTETARRFRAELERVSLSGCRIGRAGHWRDCSPARRC